MQEDTKSNKYWAKYFKKHFIIEDTRLPQKHMKKLFKIISI